jgi:hypothetical protein
MEKKKQSHSSDAGDRKMPRSSHIYTVQLDDDEHGNSLINAFTVKREMIHFVNNLPDHIKRGLVICRVRDGSWDDTVVFLDKDNLEKRV